MNWTHILNTTLLSYALIGAILWKLKVDTSGVLWHTRRFHLTWLIAWYDCWFGVYRKPNGCFYIMIPFMGITFTWYKRWYLRSTEKGRFSSKGPNLSSIPKPTRNAVIQGGVGGAMLIPDEYWIADTDEQGFKIWTLKPEAKDLWDKWACEVRANSGIQFVNGKLVSTPAPPFPEFPPQKPEAIK